MKLLLKRSQGQNVFSTPIFKLWVKIEFDDEEQALLKKYDFARYQVISADEPLLLRNAGILAFIVFIVVMSQTWSMGGFGAFLSLCAGGGAGWYYFDRKRETIYVRDFVHGRYFDCPSVVALAKKEAFMGGASSYLRQLMVTAKTWGDTETLDVEPLPPEEAKRMVIRSI